MCEPRVLTAMFFTVLSTVLAYGNTVSTKASSDRRSHRFIPCPERGYVIQLRATSAESIPPDTMSALRSVKARPVGGLGRRGFYILDAGRPIDQKDEAIAAFRSRNQLHYVSPLFSLDGEMTAILPEVVVRLMPETNPEQLKTLCRELGITIRQRLEFTEREYLLGVPGSDAQAVFAALDRLHEISFVEWAAANTAPPLQLCGPILPDDEYFPEQWHLHNTGQWGGTPGADINAVAAWQITTGDPNVVVAVLDCGVDSNHPDLVSNLVEGYDFYDDDENPDPNPRNLRNAHGTSCAGLVGAQGSNGIGVTGVAWDCRIMPIRIMSVASGGVLQACTEADIATAFRWAAEHGADILSCSWAAGDSRIIHSAVRDVTVPGGLGRDGKGCIVFIAAGNTGREIGPLWTKGYPEVVAVGATDRHDERWSYCGYGPELDLMATSGGLGFQPTDVQTTTIGSYRGFGGTSAACPIAAGVAALVLSVNPTLSNIEVQRLLFRSASDLGEPGRDAYYGWGRVDALCAVEMALAPPGPLDVLVDDDAVHDPGPRGPDVSDPNEDGSAEHPFDAIQEAINQTAPGECVVILPGVYAGVGNRDLDLGGRAVTVRSIDPADPRVTETTIIDCQGTAASMRRGFEFHRGETSATALVGLTIRNGYAIQGAAVYCTSGSSPSIRNCLFRDNSAAFQVAGIVMGFGGAIACDESSPVVQNCIFSDNFAEIEGGGVYSIGGSPTITNCTFVRNFAAAGGGMYSYAMIGPAVSNCIFWANIPDQVTGAALVSYSDIQGGWEGTGNFDADPLFLDPDNSDYHLKSEAGRWDLLSQSWVEDEVSSLCIDAGDPDADWTAEPWPHGQRINLGAYGGTPQASMSLSPVDPATDLDPDRSVTWRDTPSLTATLGSQR